MCLATQARQAIDFQRIGDFGEGFRAGGRDRDQQQLVPAAQQVHLLPAGQRGAAEDFHHFAGQQDRAFRLGPAHYPDHGEKEPQHDGQAAGHGGWRGESAGLGRRSAAGAIGRRQGHRGVVPRRRQRNGRLIGRGSRAAGPVGRRQPAAFPPRGRRGCSARASGPSGTPARRLRPPTQNTWLTKASLHFLAIFLQVGRLGQPIIFDTGKKKLCRP